MKLLLNSRQFIEFLHLYGLVIRIDVGHALFNSFLQLLIQIQFLR